MGQNKVSKEAQRVAKIREQYAKKIKKVIY